MVELTSLLLHRTLGLLFLVTFFVQKGKAQNKTLPDEIYIDTAHTGQLQLGNRNIQIVLDKSNGNLLNIKWQNKPFVQTDGIPSTDVIIGGQKMLQHATGLRITYQTEWLKKKGIALHVKQTPYNRNTTLTTTYILYPNSTNIDRVIALQSGEDTAQQTDGFYFLLPHFVAGIINNCIVNVTGPFWPATFTPADTPYDSLKNKSINYHAAPDGGFGLFSLTNTKLQTTISVFLKTNGDANYDMALNGDGSTFSIIQKNNKAVYLKPGERILSDTQHIIITKDFNEAMQAYRRITTRNMPLAKATPSWVKEAVILEILPDYFKGGFKEISAKLPFYKEIGFNTIYLMPHWSGGYSPIDLYEIEKDHGTKEDLQNLVHTAHRLGLRVLFDMVIHGFNKTSPVIQKHPEFFYRDVNDSMMIHPSWGSVMTDFMNPSYQQYMKDYVGYEYKTFGIDGYRVDAASYKEPNRNIKIPYPAYRSGAASPQLMQMMLDTLRNKNKEATLLSEVFGPVFYTVSNFAHDNQTEAMSFLIKEIEARRFSLSQYKKHIQYVYNCLPKGANRVFYTRNHDTSWFYEFFGYTPLFMNLEAIHTFFGIPEVFAGDAGYKFNPDDDSATFRFYKKLFAARKKFPEFVYGQKVLDAVESNNADVFTGLVKDEKHSSVLVVSGSGEPLNIKLSVAPQYLKRSFFSATDILHNKTESGKYINKKIELQLKPFQVIIIRLY